MLKNYGYIKGRERERETYVLRVALCLLYFKFVTPLLRRDAYIRKFIINLHNLHGYLVNRRIFCDCDISQVNAVIYKTIYQ